MAESQIEKMTIALENAGCEKSSAEKILNYLEAGMSEELIHQLRLCRCERMEDLHRMQKQIDCLDHMIRQIKQKN